jgi:hypothetical protein
VTALLGAGGRLSLFNYTGSTHLIADVAGYLAAAPAPTDPAPTSHTVLFTGASVNYTSPISEGTTCCVGTSAGGPLTGRLDVGVPVGATITAVRFQYVANTTIGVPLNIGLTRTIVNGATRTDEPASNNFVSFTQGGARTGQLALHDDVGPVGESAYYWIYIIASAVGAGGSLQICEFAIDYTMP